MKRTIALLAVLVLLVSAVASPASAAGLSPLWGASSSSAGEDSAPAAQPELLSLPAEGETADPATTASPVSTPDDEKPVNLYGFVKYLSAGMLDGLPAWQSKSHWYTFQDTNPSAAQEIGLMPDSTDDNWVFVTCAELVDDTVYGYTYDGRFFTMDFEALQRGEVQVEYKQTYDMYQFYPTEMSYDYSTGKMYVISFLQELYEVDLETGELDPDSGRQIYGEIPDADDSVYDMDYILGFSIDLDGNAYVMLAGMGAQWGGNGCSRLASLDLETGEYTVIGQTTAKAFQEQTMCFDRNTGKLYWAQGCSPYLPDEMNLYIVDTQTAELTDCGQIGEHGAGVLGMFIPLCRHTEILAVEEEAPTCTNDGHAAYYHCPDCGKYFKDADCIEETTWEELILPATGHKTELRNAKEPTCTEDGYTGDEVCAVCGEILKKGEAIPAIECPSAVFTDLNINRWYHEYTDYVISHELMNGVSDNRFAPDSKLTRGMLVTTLYRLAGEPEVTEAATFTDVPGNRYFTQAIAWAQDVGLAKGVTETRFAPESSVTREQAVTFLYRYVTLILEQEPGRGGDLTQFTDAGKISKFAEKPMAWATAEGFLEGYGDGTVGPQKSVTRAQMAKFLTILSQDF